MKKYIVSLMVCVLLVQICTAQQWKPNQDLMQPLPILSSSLLADNNRPPTINIEDNPEKKKTLDMSQLQSEDQVSATKAVVLSLLIPGVGEYYAGSKFKGQVFMGVEAAIWTGFVAYRVYGGWKEDDYKDFAAANAGVENSGKDEDFYDLVGFYSSREEANQLGMLYNPDRSYLPDTRSYYWQWDSEADRAEFRDMKEGADIAFRNAKWMLALAVLNRLVSGFDAYRTAQSINQKARSLTKFGDYKLKISPKVWGHNQSINIKLTRHL